MNSLSSPLSTKPRSLGELLRARREDVGLSQGGLAELLKDVRGVTQGKISYWERDVYHPDPGQLGELGQHIFRDGDIDLAVALARLHPPTGLSAASAA